MTNSTAELIEVKPISTHSAVEYSKSASDLLTSIKILEVDDQASYEEMALLLSKNKDLNKKAELERKKITDPIDVARKAAMDLFRPIVAYFEDGEKIAKNKMIAYSNEQERIRAEHERKLREQAAAEESRQRKIKEDQEAAWRKKEAEAKAELDRQNALIAKAKNEKQRAEAEAAAAKARAEQEKAARLAEERRQQADEIFVPAPTISPTIEKPSGISMKKNWKARITNADLVPRNYMIVNEKMLDGIAKSTKGALKIEGVEFYSEDILASR